MRNPWTQDSDDIPADAGIRSGSGRYRTVGFILWALCISGVTLFVLVRPGDLTTDDALGIAGVVVLTVVVAVLVGILAALVVRQFSVVGSRLIGLGLLLLILFALPFVLPWLIDQIDLFEQLPIDDLSEQLPLD